MTCERCSPHSEQLVEFHAFTKQNDLICMQPSDTLKSIRCSSSFEISAASWLHVVYERSPFRCSPGGGASYNFVAAVESFPSLCKRALHTHNSTIRSHDARRRTPLSYTIPVEDSGRRESEILMMWYFLSVAGRSQSDTQCLESISFVFWVWGGGKN